MEISSPNISAASHSKRSNDLPARAPKGAEISCKGWQQEAALRMLLNSFDPAVSEYCGELASGAGSDHLGTLIESLRRLGDAETLMVESGRAAGIFRTQGTAPRVLIANSNLRRGVGDWAKLDTPERLGLLLFGQIAGESWTSIGIQSLLQATYETFAAVARKHFGGGLAGRLVVSGGLGRMGGAQPLAATLSGAAFLGVEADPERITRLIRTGYCDYCVNSLDEALRILKVAVRGKQPLSVGLVGNCAEIIPELARRGVLPDLLTDQTAAHDPLHGYVPAGLTPGNAQELRHQDPKHYLKLALSSIERHVAAMVELQEMGAVTFEFGNNLRAIASRQGVTDAFKIPSFMTDYIFPIIHEGRVPLRWAALSGNAADIRLIDEALLELDAKLAAWIQPAASRVKFPGLPARSGWLSGEQSAAFGDRINRVMAEKELKAPVVIARDAIDGAPLLPPSHGIKAGVNCTIRVWPLLAGLLNAASAASWIAIQYDAGGDAQTCAHSTSAVVADGTPQAAAAVERVLSR